MMVFKGNLVEEQKPRKASLCTWIYFNILWFLTKSTEVKYSGSLKGLKVGIRKKYPFIAPSLCPACPVSASPESLSCICLPLFLLALRHSGCQNGGLKLMST